ncbi:nickel/cobalt efflux system [Hafnia psychrotolerans]|uniref:Nickel/cobalt efflux system n=2 Tax=Hafnia psychrotolerans TaxID=1477018 RepID=A0ABQ1FUY8_9GAMM|nr:nickel/cobalt efflux system [Hafnia psychrotolerans]
MLNTLNNRFRIAPWVLANVVIIIALIVVLLVAWEYWRDFVQICISMQIFMHRYLVLYLLEIRNGQYSGGLFLVTSGFIYGLLHAVGPGHGKFVITTYLSTSREKMAISRLISFTGSMMQGVVAIAFVWLLAVIFNFSMGDLSLSRWYVEKASAVFIAFFGLITLARAFGFTPWRRNTKRRLPAFSPLINPPKAVFNQVHSAETCGCGHKHLSMPDDLSGTFASRLWVILSIGIRPCSGAILILVFANAVGMFRWGMAAAMSMALGTALSITIVATLVTHAREKVMKINAKNGLAHWQHGSKALMLFAGVLLILFAMVLFFSVIPVSGNGDFVAAGC